MARELKNPITRNGTNYFLEMGTNAENITDAKNKFKTFGYDTKSKDVFVKKINDDYYHLYEKR